MNENLLPLTAEQNRIWIEWKRHPLSVAYNNYLVYQLRGDLAVELLMASIKKAASDDAFNILFMEKSGIPFQKIIKKQIKINYAEFSDDASAKQHINDFISRPFELIKSPCYRFSMVRSDEMACWYVVLVMHHILTDMTSTHLFINRVVDYYHEQCSFKQSLDLHHYLSVYQADGLARVSSANYWQNKVQNGLPTLNMLKGSLLTKKTSQQHIFTIDNNIKNRLKSIARQQKSTLFLLLMSALKVLLARYYDCNKLTIMYTVDTRPSQYKQTFGFFVGTFPMIAHIVEDATFCDLLNDITAQRKQDKNNQEISLLNILNLCEDSEANTKQNDYVVFSKTSVLANEFILKDVETKSLTADFFQEAINNLSFLYDEEDENIKFFIAYNENLFESWFIEQLAKHFAILLNLISTKAAQKIADLCFINKNDTKIKPVKKFVGQQDKFIHKKIEVYADQSPEAIAIVDGFKQITYRTLNEKANQLASYLSRKGVKKKDFVGLVADRTYLSLVAILAVLKLGAAYVPLDPHYPEKRVRYILKDSHCRHLVVNDLNLALADIKNVTIFQLQQIQPQLLQEPTTNHEVKIAINDFMYVTYTSGTTGMPKGVPVKHKNVLSLFAATEQLFRFNAKDTWTLFHSLAFDFSVWEWCGALAYGGKLIVVPFAISRDPVKFYNMVAQHAVTILNQTPSAFYQFMEADQKINARLNLRQVIFGGEKLEYSALIDWISRHGDEYPQLANMYGITEGTIHASYYRIKKSAAQRNISNIGLPLAHMQMQVLNRNRQPLPTGCVGELYISGSGLTSGYLNRPRLTDERYFKLAVNGQKKRAVWYATGDVVKKLSTGHFIYINRNDTQINWQGFRIESREIEFQLELHPNIKRAIVRLQEEGMAELLAYLVLTQPISPFEIRQFLLNTLPPHMVPTRFLSIAKVPLTINGKLDSAALANLPADMLKNEFIAANMTSAESIIAEVWQKILGMPQPPLDKNFFDYGGDSLSLLQVQNELEQIFNCSIPTEVLFLHPTITTLSEYFVKQKYPRNYAHLVDSLTENRANKRFMALNKRIINSSFNAANTIENRHV